MMNKDKYIWEDDRFRKDPYKIPEDYFACFTDRMMARLNETVSVAPVRKHRGLKPWIVWVSGIAAVLVIGWFGLRTFYWKPLQEDRFQENIALFVDYCGEELHEGQLAVYFEENRIDITNQSGAEVNEFIQMDPDLAEEYIYESVGF